MTARQPFLGWPGWRLLAETAVLTAALTLWWALVYFGADWLTELRTERVRVHLDAELQLPLVPAFLLIYRSIEWMFVLGPFVLRTRVEVRALVLALFVVTTVCGVGFVLWPADVAYTPAALDGLWARALDINHRIVLRHNLLPSMHVAFATLTLAAYWTKRGVVGRTLLALWGGLIALSTLLVHEHHVLDVLTGFLIGWAGYRWVYLPYWRTATPRNVVANPSSDPAPTA
jgi:membrane-associated phospholipid phosphatase